MSPTFWRTAALAAIGAVSLTTAIDIIRFSPIATLGYGARTDPAVPNRFTVTSVTPGASAAQAGVRAGDVLSLADFGVRERARYYQQAAGDSFTFIARRGSSERRLTLRAIPVPGGSSFLLAGYLSIKVVMLIVAALLVWRRADDPAVRALATLLIAYAYSVAIDTTWYPWPLALALLFALLPLLWSLGLAAAVQFAARFPRPSVRGPRRIIERLTPVVFVAGTAYNMAGNIAVGFFLLPRLPFVVEITQAMYAYYFLAAALAFWSANREAAGADVQRVRWTSAALAAGFSGFAVFVGLVLSGHYAPGLEVLPLTIVVIPIGLAYVILRHRLFDISFVVNRALVFGVISSIVVGVFAVLEWLLGKTLSGASHATSSLIELGTALIVGTSLKPIHARVDRLVDDVFFKDRHAADLALRRFAQEVAFITERSVLAPRTIAIVDARSNAAGSAVFFRAEDQRGFSCAAASFEAAYASIDENDPVLVALRAHREPISLLEHHSALPGAMAFPMIVRGELVGVLCCAVKRGGEIFAPDERDTLAVVANAVGLAADALHTLELRRRMTALLGRTWTAEELLRLGAEEARP